jgi:hypothetical protein
MVGWEGAAVVLVADVSATTARAPSGAPSPTCDFGNPATTSNCDGTLYGASRSRRNPLSLDSVAVILVEQDESFTVGTNERFWLNLQARFDLEQQRDLLGARLAKEVRVLDRAR